MKTFPNEGAFNRWWTGELRKCNTLVFSIVGGLMQDSGIPDRYASHTRWTGFIEGKTGTRGLDAHQLHILLELTKRRVPAYVLRLTEYGIMRLEHPAKIDHIAIPWSESKQGVCIIDALVKMNDFVFSERRLSDGNS